MVLFDGDFDSFDVSRLVTSSQCVIVGGSSADDIGSRGLRDVPVSYTHVRART